MNPKAPISLTNYGLIEYNGLNMYDSIVIGAGFSGSVIANELASRGKKVLLVEKRSHTGGNMYEEFDNSGIRIHKYGPHIFHTNSDVVFNYLKKLGEWYFYEHRVVGSIDGKLVPIPFNFKSIEILFNKDKSEKIKAKLLEYFPETTKVSILDLINHEDATVKELGEYVYEKVFANYTAKQWEIDIKDIDTSVINRVPVILGYDDRYFQDKFQFIPKNSYNEIFDNLLNHENIEVRLDTDAKKLLKLDGNKIYFEGKLFEGNLIYTGLIDELFDYQFGKLPYRSLRFEFENYAMNYYQPNSVVNYPNDFAFTRITEFKYLTNQLSDSTTTLKEYPQKYDGNNVPYYSIINEENNNLYKKYRDEADKINNLYMCGRLAEYKYYNMDQVILRALEVSKEIR